MNPELEALARRALACPGWRWGTGMLHRNWHNPTRVGEENIGHSWSGWPDLSDPATLGCLRALVLEAWGDVQFIMTYSPCNGWWNLYFGEHPDRVEFVGLSLAEALVVALEAAP